MRRAIASSVAVMMMIGGGASYALLGRHSPKMELSTSAMDAPRVETARMFAAPIAPPEPDLIAAKLAPPPIVWPDAPKPVVKVKHADLTKMDRSKPAATKTATAPKPKPNSRPKLKKQAAASAAAAY